MEKDIYRELNTELSYEYGMPETDICFFSEVRGGDIRIPVEVIMCFRKYASRVYFDFRKNCIIMGELSYEKTNACDAEVPCFIYHGERERKLTGFNDGEAVWFVKNKNCFHITNKPVCEERD